MDDRSLMRYHEGYAALPVTTVLDWSDLGGWAGATEMCNNNGACRKRAPGLMCPSFRATGDERHTTRGRANTLRLALTGQLGSVFQESCQAAITYIRSRCTHLGLKPDFYQETDIHVHVPELWGVDGPSAGITIATAVVSAVSGIAVKRGIAMTGEITLRGQVRPIGGLKEKLLAAHRAGIRTVLIPQDNEQDLVDIPDPIREKLEIIVVSHMDEVLPLALAISDPAKLFAPSQHDTV